MSHEASIRSAYYWTRKKKDKRSLVLPREGIVHLPKFLTDRPRTVLLFLATWLVPVHYRQSRYCNYDNSSSGTCGHILIDSPLLAYQVCWISLRKHGCCNAINVFFSLTVLYWEVLVSVLSFVELLFINCYLLWTTFFLLTVTCMNALYLLFSKRFI